MIVLVEIFGKKFRVNIKANTLNDAKLQIIEKMRFTIVMDDKDIFDFFNKEIFK